MEPYSSGELEVPAWCNDYIKKPMDNLPKCINKLPTLELSKLPISIQTSYATSDLSFIDSDLFLSNIKPVIRMIPMSTTTYMKRPYQDSLIYDDMLKYCTKLFTLQNRQPYNLVGHQLHIMNRWTPDIVSLPSRNEKISCTRQTSRGEVMNKCYSGLNKDECDYFKKECVRNYVAADFLMYILQEFKEIGFVVRVNLIFDELKANPIITEIAVTNSFRSSENYVGKAYNSIEDMNGASDLVIDSSGLIQ